MSAPDGARVATRQLTLDEAANELNIEVQTVERGAVTPVDDPLFGGRTIRPT